MRERSGMCAGRVTGRVAGLRTEAGGKRSSEVVSPTATAEFATDSVETVKQVAQVHLQPFGNISPVELAAGPEAQDYIRGRVSDLG